jgi:putative beta-lysine N-acetyltransferase
MNEWSEEMKNDVIETFGHSLIQHGKSNDRIYLMNLAQTDFPEIIPFLDRLAVTRGYTKIFAKVPAFAKRIFMDSGYDVEATIPGLYRGEEEAFFMAKFFCQERQKEKKPFLIKEVLETAQSKTAIGEKAELGDLFTYRVADKEDLQSMAEVYKEVFATYPFPIHDPEYLEGTMDDNVAYVGMWKKERLVALASAEMDVAGRNAEMTDFATLPEFRGRGLANFLLAEMEEAMRTCGIRTAYTIARAYSYGMNITFAKNGYSFSGTLVNNTHISGGLESMNVWHKPL